MALRVRRLNSEKEDGTEGTRENEKKNQYRVNVSNLSNRKQFDLGRI